MIVGDYSQVEPLRQAWYGAAQRDAQIQDARRQNVIALDQQAIAMNNALAQQALQNRQNVLAQDRNANYQDWQQTVAETDREAAADQFEREMAFKEKQLAAVHPTTAMDFNAAISEVRTVGMDPEVIDALGFAPRQTEILKKYNAATAERLIQKDAALDDMVGVLSRFSNENKNLIPAAGRFKRLTSFFTGTPTEITADEAKSIDPLWKKYFPKEALPKTHSAISEALLPRFETDAVRYAQVKKMMEKNPDLFAAITEDEVGKPTKNFVRPAWTDKFKKKLTNVLGSAGEDTAMTSPKSAPTEEPEFRFDVKTGTVPGLKPAPTVIQPAPIEAAPQNVAAPKPKKTYVRQPDGSMTMQ